MVKKNDTLHDFFKFSRKIGSESFWKEKLRN